MSGRLFNRTQTDTLDDIVPVHDIKVSLRYQRAVRARLIPTGTELPLTNLPGGHQAVTVAKVVEHEMVVFDLAH